MQDEAEALARSFLGKSETQVAAAIRRALAAARAAGVESGIDAAIEVVDGVFGQATVAAELRKLKDTRARSDAKEET